MNASSALAEIARRERGRVLSSLVRSLSDFDLAEEALADAFAAAAEQWPQRGVPDRPAAWLTTVARNRAIDLIRRQQRLAGKLRLLAADPAAGEDRVVGDPDPGDDRLGLIFLCCHPALSPEARVALTLRALGGLTTAEIAHAFLASEAAMHQRLTRAKSKIRLAGIPFGLTGPGQLGERTQSVMAVIYLIFNEGYSRHGGSSLVDRDLCSEALHLAETFCGLLPTDPEAAGLAALLWLTEARRPARTDRAGELVLLPDQDRATWDGHAIQKGTEHLRRARALGSPGPYTLQAEIGAVHAAAGTFERTDWPAIVSLYERLLALQPSPVVGLNHAAATAMVAGPAVGLDLMAALAGSLAGYQPYHAARAELLARAGRYAEAVAEFRQALRFSINDVERRHLERRLQRLAAGVSGLDPAT